MSPSPPHLVGRVAPSAARARPGGGARFRNFAQRFIGRSAEVPLVKFRDPLEGVDLLHRLVVADADDAWKTQRVPARMASRMLYRVERNLEHHLGSHHP